MADILTPTTARKTEEFSQTQVDLVRNSLGIADAIYDPAKTYIIFDADAGNNNLYLDTGSIKTYSILKGNGGLSGSIATNYNDTGGVKVLNYVTAGRYIITIEGAFNGIDTTGAIAADKDKYIEIIGGSNYPVTIPGTAFEDCENLISVRFDYVTSCLGNSFLSCGQLETAYFKVLGTTGLNTFKSCSKLKNIDFRALTTVDDRAFESCSSIEYLYLPLATAIGSDAFETNSALNTVILPVATRIDNGAFRNCIVLERIYIPVVTLLEDNAFGMTVTERALKYISLTSCTSIGQNAFSNRLSIDTIDIKYSAGASYGSNSFSTTFLKDLYVIGAANLTEAQSIETKMITAGMTQLAGYRLLY